MSKFYAGMIGKNIERSNVMFVGGNVASRKDIKNHREQEHQMFRRVFCKYFPKCMEVDECLFEHGENVGEDDVNSQCSKEENCDDKKLQIQ